MSIENTLEGRGKRYGDFIDHAKICQALKVVMMTAGNGKAWVELSASHKQALEVIADKIARILNGDPNYQDNWHDIQGYAKLAEDRCVHRPEEPYQQLQTVTTNVSGSGFIEHFWGNSSGLTGAGTICKRCGVPRGSIDALRSCARPQLYSQVCTKEVDL